MGLFSHNKKEESPKPNLLNLSEAPDLRLPELPDLQDQENQIQPLPKFPNTSFGNSMGIETIKSNVAPKERDFEVHDLNNTIRTREIDEGEYQKSPAQSLTSSKPKEPLFVKLDKFREAVLKFNEVKDKVSEIERTLEKIREVKEREEQELKSWEEEVRSIKEKISNIDSSLFNKI